MLGLPGGIRKNKDLDTPLWWFILHVLLESKPTFEEEHGLIKAICSWGLYTDSSEGARMSKYLRTYYCLDVSNDRSAQTYCWI